MKTPIQDAQIIQAMQRGDREAYRVLMDRHHSSIYRFCYRLSGNTAEADSLAHDAFVEAYLKLDQLRNPERFGAWVREMALNLFRMNHRQRTRHPTESLEDLAEELEDIAFPDPQAAFATYVQRCKLDESLNRLTSEHRLALLLHCVEGLTYEEVATFIEAPVGTVMSRLHRARHSLRRIMDSLEEEDVMTSVNEIDFAREVDAELHLLLRMFPEDSSARERLSVVLSKSPERLVQLLRECEDDEATRSLALLLRRLGSPALKIVLKCRLSTDENLRHRAHQTLVRMLNQNRASVRAEGARMATREAYLLLNTLLESEVGDEQKADLILQLMVETKDEPNVLLLTNLLLCGPDVAFSRLMDRLLAWSSVREMYRFPDALYALIRTGTRFGRELLNGVEGEGKEKLEIAVAALEGLVRAMNHEWWSIEETTEDRQLWEARFRRKWSPPLRKDRDPAVLQEIQNLILQWLGGEDDSLREAALRMTGMLNTSEHRKSLRRWINSGDSSTRILAIRAASDLFDLESVPNTVEAAKGEDTSVRLTALASLGRFLAVPAQPMEWTLRENTAGIVCKAAFSMLGEAEAGVLSVLEELRQSSEPKVAEAARNAWWGPFYACKNSTPQRPHPNDGEGGKPASRSWQMKDTVHEGAEPQAQISLDGALRELPEIRVYEERELTKLIAQVCNDYSATRRYLIEEGLMTRHRGQYEMTEWGEAVWRVERYLRDRYMKSE